MSAEQIERIARVLCQERGYDPDALEPGNVIVHPTDDLDEWTSAEGINLDQLADDGTRRPDGHDGKDPCHFMWRQFIGQAQAVMWTLSDEAASREVEIKWFAHVGGGHEGPLEFDNESEAVAYYEKEMAVPSYMGAGHRRHGYVVKRTIITETVR